MSVPEKSPEEIDRLLREFIAREEAKGNKPKPITLTPEQREHWRRWYTHMIDVYECGLQRLREALKSLD